MDDLKKDLAAVHQRLARMEHRTAEMLEDIRGLQGTFTSIERHLIRLFEEQAAIQAWREKIEARIDALEKRQPPAA